MREEKKKEVYQLLYRVDWKFETVDRFNALNCERNALDRNLWFKLNWFK